jgi:hypothetical protein
MVKPQRNVAHRVTAGALKDSTQRAGKAARGQVKRVSKQERRVNKAKSGMDKLYRQKMLLPRNVSARAKDRLAKNIRKAEQKVDKESLKLEHLQEQAGSGSTYLDKATDEMT